MKKLTFRTSPPETYLPPSREEMREAANVVGLNSFSPSLVADMCNMSAGGRINPPSSYKEIISGQVEENFPNHWSGTRGITWELKNGAHTHNRDELFQELFQDKIKYHQNVCDFLQTLELGKFPGNSPLQKSMAVLKMLSQKKGGKGEGEGEILPIFQENEFPEGEAQELHDTMDVVESLDQEEMQMLDPDHHSHQVDENGHLELNKQKVAEDMGPGSKQRVMLEISRHLDKFTKLQVRKQKLVTPDPAGEEVRTRPIAHIGELAKVSQSSWASRQQSSSYFNYQAVTGQLPVRERVTRQEKKQAIFILVDGSGSMKGEKHFKATGVVMNRLKTVLSGDAEVWVSVFSDSISEPQHAADPTEARELIKQFSNGNFNGGGTAIATAVKSAHNFIEQKIADGEALYRPEVVVLTDEDSSISGLKKAQIPGTRVHGFAMGVTNKPLVDFCKSTGGVGIQNF